MQNLLSITVKTMILTTLGFGILACQPDGADSSGEHSPSQPATAPTTQPTTQPTSQPTTQPANHSSGTDLQPVIGGHLPEPTDPKAAPTGEVQTAQAVFAGGCFWCTEAVFEQLQGVSAVVSGYAGGKAENANYQAVSAGSTGHAEVIRITYDPTVITFGQLLKVFFATHDPTTLNRQGNDIGPQYRSSVFYADEAQKQAAADYIAQLNAAGVFRSPIVTKLEPLEQFFEAEAYHQDFARNNPMQGYVRAVSHPKVRKVHEKFSDLLKPDAEKP